MPLLNAINDLFLVSCIGNDNNDLNAMKAIKEVDGLVGCPCNVSVNVLKTADFISEHEGGNGAVWVFIEYFTSLRFK